MLRMQGLIIDASTLRNLVIGAILAEFVIIYNWNKLRLYEGKIYFGISDEEGIEKGSPSNNSSEGSNHGTGSNGQAEGVLAGGDPDYDPIDPPQLRDPSTKGLGGGR